MAANVTVASFRLQKKKNQKKILVSPALRRGLAVSLAGQAHSPIGTGLVPQATVLSAVCVRARRRSETP